MENLQSGEYGTQQTEEGFDAVIAVVQAVEISKQDDGKVTFPGDLVNFIGATTRIIRGFEGANQIPKELSDLDEAELGRLTDKFGDIVNDERYQRVFFGLMTAGDAVLEIIQEKKAAPPVA